jgi:hypothetical protein
VARIQLALNVPDVDEAISFYTTLLGTGPHKTRPGYANFAVEDPPLKLVLFESDGDRLDHLGIEVDSADEVAAATERLRAGGLSTDVRERELCCHAVQDKVWTDGPDGRWEVYVVADDLLDTTDTPTTTDAAVAPVPAVATGGTAAASTDDACCPA